MDGFQSVEVEAESIEFKVIQNLAPAARPLLLAYCGLPKQRSCSHAIYWRRMKKLLLSLMVWASALLAQGNPDWHKEFPAFKIAGNVYYVGTADLAVYLIRTPQGNILINSDFAEDVPTVRKAIEQLGFKYSDTKILLISHAHGDHDEGIGLMQKE